ncbi:hypothetical protein ABFS83_02G037900 [Erythranthe nasuta]
MNSKNMHICTLFPLFFLVLVSPAFGLNFDGSLLLSFKYSIIDDPLSVLDNWNYNDATPCLWTGVTCAEVQSSIGVPDLFRVVGLTLPNFQLLGVIPAYLGFIPHLKKLDLSSNFLNGTLPISLFNASELEVLSLSNNAISGAIPEFITASKSNLKLLNLSDNAFTGTIPSGITSLQNLSVVSLRSNYLTGFVPSGIRSFEILDLSSNLLSGSLPVEFGGVNLKYLNLSSNKISGLVPEEFAKKIPADAVVDLSFNDLSGEIPEVVPLTNQKTEFYAGNEGLCGKPMKKLCTIPSTLSTPPNGISTNTSSTSSPAIAAIPKTMDSSTVPDSTGTTAAGAGIPPAKGLKPAAIAGIAVVPLAGVGVLAAIFLFIHQKKKRKLNETETKQGASSITTIKAYEFEKDSDQSTVKETRNLPTWTCLRITNGEETSEEATTESDSEDQSSTNYAAEEESNNREIRSLVMVDGETDLEMDTLFKASAYVLGSSGAGVVYKAVLQDGTAFAVRRIGESGGGARRLKEFEQQVRAVAKMRHQNLVRVRGFYWGDDEKLVICDYVSNGSLANIGYRKIGSSPYHLPFETRLKIAKGVAKGLTYIHTKNKVHGNIKPSNILLTPDMDPIISDFGLHRLIHGKHTRKSDGPVRHYGSMRSTDLHNNQPVHGSPNTGRAGFVGCTSPYHAPESFKNLKPNPKWDVYSFGIVLLELLTGKVFSDRELGQWTAGSVAEDPARVLRMADVAIRGDVAGREEAVLAWFKLGFSCASLAPHKRPCMKDAVHVLEKIPCRSN